MRIGVRRTTSRASVSTTCSTPVDAGRCGTSSTTAVCGSGPCGTTARSWPTSTAATTKPDMANYHDVVVVGGGGAGLRAAIAVAETNPALRVAVISKVYPMRSHTVSAEGGAAAVAGP